MKFRCESEVLLLQALRGKQQGLPSDLKGTFPEAVAATEVSANEAELQQFDVREAGLEPAQCYPLAPQDGNVP
ncbi:MAG: hypothetical protein H0T79_18395 [Deltaproteobacteria bacterium]|nr:hypothetical protein [Deltaproteobacteria bacterium]